MQPALSLLSRQGGAPDLCKALWGSETATSIELVRVPVQAGQVGGLGSSAKNAHRLWALSIWWRESGIGTLGASGPAALLWRNPLLCPLIHRNCHAVKTESPSP